MGLHDEIETGNSENILKYLNEGNDVNAVSLKGESLLHISVRCSNTLLVDILLEKKASVNIFNRDSLTSLHYVSRTGNKCIAEKLLKFGANLTSQDNNGWYPLHYAAFHGHLSIVELFLSEKEEIINNRDNFGFTALHIACRFVNREVISFLLKHGASILSTEVSKSPLLYLPPVAGIDGLDVNPKNINFHQEIPLSLEKYSNDWSKLYKNSQYSDLEIVLEAVVETQELENDQMTEDLTLHLKQFSPNGKIVNEKQLSTEENADKLQVSDFENITTFSGVEQSEESKLAESTEISNSSTFDNHTATSSKSSESKGLGNFDHSDSNFVSTKMETLDNSSVYTRFKTKTHIIPAHSLVLNVRCPALLKSAPFREIESPSRIRIRGVTLSLFSTVLEYIYSGRLKFTEDEVDLNFAFNLLLKGNELGLSSLSALAENLILNNVLPTNVLSIFRIALDYNCYPNIEQYCRFYILKHFTDIKTTSEELEWIASHLAPIFRVLIFSESVSIPTFSIEKVPDVLFLMDRGRKDRLYKVRVNNKLLENRADVLTGPLIEAVKKALKQIVSKVEAEPFLVPVDYVALAIPEYPEIIKHPMDLGTVGMNLNNGVYTILSDWAADVRLIWDNARIYNVPGSAIFLAAEKMSEYFEQIYTNMWKSFPELGSQYDCLVPKPQGWYLETYMNNFNAYNARIKQASLLKTPKHNKTASKSSSNKRKQKLMPTTLHDTNPLTDEELDDLESKLKLLDENQTSHIVNIFFPYADQQQSNLDLEIEVDKIAPELVRQAQTYVYSVLGIPTPKKVSNEI